MLTTVAQVVILAFIVSLFAIVAFRLLSGDIKVAGLLTDKETDTFSPGRLQLLLATVGGAIFYFSRIASATDQTTLPPVPTELLVILGASNAGYLGGKVYSRFFSKHARGAS